MTPADCTPGSEVAGACNPRNASGRSDGPHRRRHHQRSARATLPTVTAGSLTVDQGTGNTVTITGAAAGHARSSRSRHRSVSRCSTSARAPRTFRTSPSRTDHDDRRWRHPQQRHPGPERLDRAGQRRGERRGRRPGRPSTATVTLTDDTISDNSATRRRRGRRVHQRRHGQHHRGTIGGTGGNSGNIAAMNGGGLALEGAPRSRTSPVSPSAARTSRKATTPQRGGGLYLADGTNTITGGTVELQPGTVERHHPLRRSRRRHRDRRWHEHPQRPNGREQPGRDRRHRSRPAPRVAASTSTSASTR